MNKLFTTLCAMWIIVCAASAQRAITGNIVDRDTKEAVMQATVSLLKQDSTFVKGVISDNKGHFSITAPNNGKYLLQIIQLVHNSLKIAAIEVTDIHVMRISLPVLLLL